MCGAIRQRVPKCPFLVAFEEVRPFSRSYWKGLSNMAGFTLLLRSYYYLRRRSPAPPFPPDHRQAGERAGGYKYLLKKTGKNTQG